MFKRKITFASTCIALSAGITVNVGAAGVAYMLYVTEEMSKTDFWSEEDGLLATREETEVRNTLIIAEKDTNMYDLKNHTETLDGISRGFDEIRTGGREVLPRLDIFGQRNPCNPKRF